MKYKHLDVDCDSQSRKSVRSLTDVDTYNERQYINETLDGFFIKKYGFIFFSMVLLLSYITYGTIFFVLLIFLVCGYITSMPTYRLKLSYYNDITYNESIVNNFRVIKLL